VCANEAAVESANSSTLRWLIVFLLDELWRDLLARV
jgi:hypothetical protein